jgi:hypothetical protein
VITEIVKKRSKQFIKGKFLLWRTCEHKKIDLITEKNDVITAYEEWLGVFQMLIFCG